MDDASALRHRHPTVDYDRTLRLGSAGLGPTQQQSRWARIAQWFQDSCYQILAYTVWDRLVSGFKPGRVRAMQLLDIQSSDCVLLVGEGSGLDFECLPDTTNKRALKAFDFSPEMVRQSKIKAEQFGIPQDSCFVGDAQHLPFTGDKFEKIYFPLSIASIPNPALALQEAERVLSPHGKIAIFDKLVDDDVPITWRRRFLNVITQFTFADINRNLSKILLQVPALKLIQYESLKDKLEGVFARRLGQNYRIAVIVRQEDYPNQSAVSAKVA